MTSPTHVVLRVLQSVSSIIVLGLSAYLTQLHKPTQSHETSRALSTEFDILLFASSLALCAVYSLELIPYFTKKAINQYVIFLAQASISGFYFGTFIAMAVSVSKIQHCSGLMCSALRADVVFAALSYFFWITSTTIHAIQMARGDRKHLKIAAAKEGMENVSA